MYILAKHLHLTLVGVSISLFILRFLIAQRYPAVLRHRLVKIVPHVIDTALLASAIWLCFILQQAPIRDSWLTVKVACVIGYIILASLALKRATSKPEQWVSFFAALLLLAYTGTVAVTKTPLFFLR